MQFICDSNAALMCYAITPADRRAIRRLYLHMGYMLGNGSYTAMDQYEERTEHTASSLRDL